MELFFKRQNKLRNQSTGFIHLAAMWLDQMTWKQTYMYKKETGKQPVISSQQCMTVLTVLNFKYTEYKDCYCLLHFQ